MFVRILFLAMASALIGARTTSAQAQEATTTAAAERIELRDLDRACVRIVNVSGASPFVFDSRETRVRRLVADVRASFGTGFFVHSSGIIATAAHVTRGAHVVAVLTTGSDEPIPARIVYVDPMHDIAFLHVAVTPAAIVRVPATQRRLSIAEAVSASGFPLDVRERFPAAVSGVLSRENNDGTLHTSLAVNPGNSGGPVIDLRGELVGLVSQGSNMRAGAQGFGILEPVRFVAPGLAIAIELAATRAEPPTEYDRSLARVVADLVGTDTERRVFERTPLDVLFRAGAAPTSPEAAMIVAAHAWNIHIDLLEHHHVREVVQLPEDVRADAAQLRELAVRLVSGATREAPYVRTSYSFGRSVLVQGTRSFVVRSTASGRG